MSADCSKQNAEIMESLLVICNYFKYVWLHFLETIGRRQFKIRDPRMIVTDSVRQVLVGPVKSADPLLRSCNVNNVCDYNRIVIKYDHE